ncbi:TVB29 protein, partial [Columbina picui]|nr:TVB29 protein [Columbina picui]
MLWYQQSPSSVLKLIASFSTWMQNSYEKGFIEVKFEINRDNNDYSVMMIKNLTPNDAAMCGCVARDY